MTVLIDGQPYLSASDLSGNTDEMAKAIIRMLISGYYASMHCHVDGSHLEGASNCGECSGCHAYRVAVSFLGGYPKSKEEPTLKKLWDACSRE